MCVLQAESTPAPVRKRSKLWELTPGLHCAVVGTCLSFPDLVKIGRKVGVVPENDASDYEVHAWFVQSCNKPSPLTRLLNKRLDRAWRTAIGNARSARDEAALAAYWSGSLKKSDIPGPFWAVVTHPAATADLRSRAYGDVHMLSHRMGNVSRDASRRLHVAETDRDELKDRLALMTRRLAQQDAMYKRSVERHEQEINALATRLQDAETQVTTLSGAESRLRTLESGEAYRNLRNRCNTLSSDLEETKRSLDIETGRCEVLEREIAVLRRANGEAVSQLRQAEAERVALEAVMKSDATSGNDKAEVPAIDLCGRRIAYVGGREAAIHHLRALIERANGQFSHHDGGVEDSSTRLDRVLSQADVVLCPIDCVSHSACLRAKKFCKRTAKTFVPLRSASLSSLAAELHRTFGDEAAGVDLGSSGRRSGDGNPVPPTPMAK